MKIPAVLAVAVAVAGCASSRSSERTASSTAPEHSAQAAPARSPEMMQMCPMAVPGTTVSPQDTSGGEALTFTTSSGQVDELRRRVRAMADMHNQHHAGAHGEMAHGDMGQGAIGPAQAGQGEATEQGGMGRGGTTEHGQMGQGGMSGAAGPMPPPARASVEDVEGGARLSLAAQDPSQADQLRSTVRAHAERMQQDGCGILGHPSR